MLAKRNPAEKNRNCMRRCFSTGYAVKERRRRARQLGTWVEITGGWTLVPSVLLTYFTVGDSLFGPKEPLKVRF
jgi:hypothetical protein